MLLITIVPPTEDPISADDLKEDYVRIDSPTEDALLASFISAAVEHGENVLTRRAWTSRTLELVLDAFPCEICLPFPNVTSVTSIKYLDSQNVEQTLAVTDYQKDDASTGTKSDIFAPMRIRPAYGMSWPQTYAVMNAVRVRYVCGWSGADQIPDAIKTWLKIRVASMYEIRESVIVGQTIANIPRDYVDGLLDRFVVYD